MLLFVQTLRGAPPCISAESPCILKIAGRPVRIGLHPPPRNVALPEISWNYVKDADLAGLCARARSLMRRVSVGWAISRVLSLVPKFPFPGNGDQSRQRLGSNAGLC